MGLIAQEVADVVPEIVSLDPIDPEVDKVRYYQVDYGQLIPLLVRSIQEQQAMIDVQKAQIAALEAQVAGLNEITGLSASTSRPGS
jgi:hypothetical protein